MQSKSFFDWGHVRQLYIKEWQLGRKSSPLSTVEYYLLKINLNRRSTAKKQSCRRLISVRDLGTKSTCPRPRYWLTSSGRCLSRVGEVDLLFAWSWTGRFGLKDYCWPRIVDWKIWSWVYCGQKEIVLEKSTSTHIIGWNIGWRKTNIVGCIFTNL